MALWEYLNLKTWPKRFGLHPPIEEELGGELIVVAGYLEIGTHSRVRRWRPHKPTGTFKNAAFYRLLSHAPTERSLCFSRIKRIGMVRISDKDLLFVSSYLMNAIERPFIEAKYNRQHLLPTNFLR